MVIQNRLYWAQLLRDRFETYWKTYGSVSDAEIKEFERFPEDYMNVKKYEAHYKNHPKDLHKYIHISHLYEFLAFSYVLRKVKLKDPLGEQWSKRWAKMLITQKEFLDVHEYYRSLYPDFADYIDKIFIEES